MLRSWGLPALFVLAMATGCSTLYLSAELPTDKIADKSRPKDQKCDLLDREGVPYSLPSTVLDLRVGGSGDNAVLAIATKTTRVADPDHCYLLQHRPSVWSSDESTIRVNDRGLLQGVEAASRDETAEVVQTLAKAALSFVALEAGGGTAVLTSPSPDVVHAEYLLAQSTQPGPQRPAPYEPIDSLPDSVVPRLRFIPIAVGLESAELKELAKQAAGGAAAVTIPVEQLVSKVNGGQPVVSDVPGTTGNLQLAISDVTDLNGDRIDLGSVDPVVGSVKGILVRSPQLLMSDIELGVKKSRLWKMRSDQLHALQKSITAGTKKKVDLEGKLAAIGDNPTDEAKKALKKKHEADKAVVEAAIKQSQSHLERLRLLLVRSPSRATTRLKSTHDNYLGAISKLRVGQGKLLPEQDGRLDGIAEIIRSIEIEEDRLAGAALIHPELGPQTWQNERFRALVLRYGRFFRRQMLDAQGRAKDGEYEYRADIDAGVYGDGSVVAARHTIQFLAPDFSRIAVIPMFRSPAVRVEHKLVLVDGMVATLETEKPSTMLALARLPLALADAALELPAKILKLRVDISDTQKALLTNRKESLQAELDIADLRSPDAQREALSDLQLQLELLEAQAQIESFKDGSHARREFERFNAELELLRLQVLKAELQGRL